MLSRRTVGFLLPVIIFCSGIWYFKSRDGSTKRFHRTCVIGAGYGGLATARYLLQHGIEFTVFEAQKTFGGVWRYRTTEEDGLPPFTGVYKNLRTNTPRQTMEFANFTFPDTTPSYPTESCFYKYLQKFAKEFDLEKHIQFQSFVTSVKWAENQWRIDYKKTDTKETYTATCDFVVVAIGHYNQPKIPKFKGQENFKGQIIHAQKYKDSEVYRNRRVLLIGAGPSGLDLAIQLTNVTSRLVHSHHLNYSQPNFGVNYVKKPDLKMFLKNGAVFQDDSFEKIDNVILCTGYDFDFNFLDESCSLNTTAKYVVPVYQHMVNIRRPSMVVLGLATPSITRILDAQAEYAVGLIANKFHLPSQATMMKSWSKHMSNVHDRGRNIDDVNLLFDDMDEYFGNIAEEAGIARVPPVLTIMRDFDADYRLTDLLNYRDFDYEVLDQYHFNRWYAPRNRTCDINN